MPTATDSQDKMPLLPSKTGGRGSTLLYMNHCNIGLDGVSKLVGDNAVDGAADHVVLHGVGIGSVKYLCLPHRQPWQMPALVPGQPASPVPEPTTMLFS